MRSTGVISGGVGVFVVAIALGCGRDAVPHDGDGLDVRGLPADVQRDYAVFASKCSKCHALARPLALAAREDSDEYWARYVERMRRQPGAGISPGDGITVRRFLHYYSHMESARRHPDAGPMPDFDPTVDGGQ